MIVTRHAQVWVIVYVRTHAHDLSHHNLLMYTQANNAVTKYITMLRSLTQAALNHALHYRKSMKKATHVQLHATWTLIT